MARGRPSPYVRGHRPHPKSRPEQRRSLARSAGACPPRSLLRRKPHIHRSAGACPPRSLNQAKNARDPIDQSRFLGRPRHGEGQAIALRSRAPPLSQAGRHRDRESLLRPVLNDRGMARDRPSPYVRGHHWNGEGQALALRFKRCNLGKRKTHPRTMSLGWRGLKPRPLRQKAVLASQE